MSTDQWYVNLFGFLENKTLAHRLNLAVNVLITVVLFVLIDTATGIVVAELSRARGLTHALRRAAPPPHRLQSANP